MDGWLSSRPVAPPEGFTASLGRFSNTGHRGEAGGVPLIQEQILAVVVGDVPVLVQLKLQQSSPLENLMVPQIQFIVRLLNYQLRNRDKYAQSFLQMWRIFVTFAFFASVPGVPGECSRALGVALTPGVVLPSVRPPVVAFRCAN